MRRPIGLALAFVGVAAAGCNKGTTTTAPTLSAQCAATPSAGPAPLSVVFTLSVAGAEGTFTVAVNYGDGTQGTDPDRAHVYLAPGAYSASFTVTTASQSARCSTPIAVAAAPTPTPTPHPDQPPVPFYKTDPPASGSTITGKAPLTVSFNMCRSTDDGDTLYYKMDLDGDGTFEFHGATGADCRHEVTLAAGTHEATICVTDVDCSTWPLCEGLPPLHPFQCRTYTVIAAP